MPYPDKLFNELTQNYSLSDDQKKTLLDTLKVEGMQELLEANWLDPNSLIKRHERQQKFFIISPIKAQTLVTTYQNLKNEPQFQKISSANVLLWIENDTDLCPYVISPGLARSTLAMPNLLSDLQDLIKKYPDKIKEWAEIRDQIQRIHNLPHTKFRDRKTLSLEVNTRMEDIKSFVQINQPLLLDYLDFAQILFQYINQQVKLLEEAAKTYFESLYKTQNKMINKIDFLHKKDGDQLGRRMLIEYQLPGDNTQHRIIYHVKTHQHGSTSKNSSTKPIDPKELFIYKVFEYMGFGPKVHFFFNSLSRGGFFIATQDASFSKKSNCTKLFKTYEEMNQEKKLKHDEKTYINLSNLDILARIFNIRDLTTNPSNFGCTEVGNSNHSKWIILDFRIEDYDQYVIPGIFDGFLTGNGMYNYYGFLGDTLRDRDLANRIKTGKQVIEMLDKGRIRYSQAQDRKPPLSTAIEKAYVEIVAYITEYGSHLGLEINAALKNLEKYKMDVLENFKTLAMKIKEYQSEPMPSSSNSSLGI